MAWGWTPLPHLAHARRSTQNTRNGSRVRNDWYTVQRMIGETMGNKWTTMVPRLSIAGLPLTVTIETAVFPSGARETVDRTG